MSDHIDTRDGTWRKATAEEANRSKTDALILDALSHKSYWVKEEPVPPLPTDLWTVIRVTWRDETDETHRVLTLDHAVDDPQDLAWSGLHPQALPSLITGFEVLASPERWLRDRTIREEVRREAVKAVLNRVAEEHALRSDQLDAIAYEFKMDE